MPCGTGKTLITYLISLAFDNIILLSPLIATTDQLIIHYKKYYSKETLPINFNIVHSQGNRNYENIELGNKNIIGATFDSCDIINKLIPKLNGSIFIVIDECHNLSNTMLIDSNNEVNKILTGNNKILFVSATPKNYNNDYINIFGSTRYTLSWDYAIKNNYICNYEFYYPNADKIVEYINEIKFDKSIIEKTKLIYKAFFLLESIKNLNIKKCIVYLKTVEEASQFHKILGLINIYHNLKLAIYSIDYKTGKNVRNTAITKFRNNATKISVILNVHVLDEGIDIPECDSVFLTNPNNNPINIIQRISRANRLHKNKVIANILLWTKDHIKLNDIIKLLADYVPVKFPSTNANKFINNFKNIENNIKKNLSSDVVITNLDNNKAKVINPTDTKIALLNTQNQSNRICICGKKFKYPCLMERHLKAVKCDEIKKPLDNAAKINKTNEIVACKYCYKEFNKKFNASRHEDICKEKNIRNNDKYIIDLLIKNLQNEQMQLEDKIKVQKETLREQQETLRDEQEKLRDQKEQIHKQDIFIALMARDLSRIYNQPINEILEKYSQNPMRENYFYSYKK